MTLNGSFVHPPGNIMRDGDEFPYPTFGAEMVKWTAVEFDSTVPLTLFTIPSGARITEVKVVIATAWDSATSDVLVVGTSDDDDAYVNDLDLQSAGTSRDGDTSMIAIDTVELTSDTAIIADITSVGGSLTEGSAIVMFKYVLK